MSIIKHPLLYTGNKGEKHLYTLFDSGAYMSCIHPDYLEDLEVPQHLGRPRWLGTASEAHYIEIEYRVTLDFYINDVRLSDEFLVVPGLTEEAIIGATTMQKWRIKMDFEHEQLVVDPIICGRYATGKLAYLPQSANVCPEGRASFVGSGARLQLYYQLYSL